MYINIYIGQSGKKGQQDSDVPEISSEGSRVWLLRNQMLERGMVSGSRKNKNQKEENLTERLKNPNWDATIP